MRKSLAVSSAVVAAARLKVKRDRARGLPIDAAIQAIADARPARRGEVETGAAEGRTG